MEKTLLNLIPGACSPEVHLSQYDKGRAVPFKLAEGKSAYSVPDGSEIVVQATKPSGLGFVVPVTFDGDTATMTITETMSNEYGRFPAELSITNNGNRIGTANFVMNIERSPHPEGTIDGDAESLLPELTLLVERIEAAADSVDEDTQTVTEAKAEVLQAKADTLQAKADTLSARDESVSAKDLAVSSAETSVEASQRAEQLVGSVETKADAIVKTASGEIASFTDGGDELPMKSLKVNIVPQQSGSGDPSPDNVRPISGYTDVNVNVAGGNLFDKALYPFLKDNDGKGWFIVGSRLRKGGGIENATLGMPCKPNTRYRIAATIGYPLFRIAYGKMADLSFQTGSADQTIYNTQADNTTIGYREVIYQTGADATFLFIQFPYGYHTEGADSLIVEEIANTYPISLGQTVYGGTLEVVSGKLTLTHASIVLDGSQPVSINGVLPYGGVQAIITPTPAKAYGSPSAYSDILCDRFRPYAGEEMGIINGRTVNRNLYFNMPSTATTAALAREWFGNNPTTVVYKLATPTEITLTPTQVTTLLGDNNIWANSGTVEVEYRADTTLAYNELLSLIASLS